MLEKLERLKMLEKQLDNKAENIRLFSLTKTVF